MSELLDTDVIVDILRKHPKAVAWIRAGKNFRAAIPSLVMMELYRGCRDKGTLTKTRKSLEVFPVAHIRERDSQLALELFRTHCLSSGISMPDAIIAAMAINRGSTLLSFNTKHFAIVKNLKVVAPYSR